MRGSFSSGSNSYIEKQYNIGFLAGAAVIIFTGVALRNRYLHY